MTELWFALSAWLQDLLLLAGLLLPLLLVGWLCLRGYRLWPLLGGLLRRHAVLSLTFTLLIAISVGNGDVFIAQERGLREGSARSAEKFDMIVAAPGSEMTVMLASVYLEPTALPLLDGEIYDLVDSHEQVALAAPLAFGDSYEGAPVVGTTADFVEYLSDGLASGRMFETIEEAIIGARVALDIGDRFEPVHGDGSQGVLDEHGAVLEVVGTMPMTGSPWDQAILVPVEQVWDVHALPIGHGPDWDGTLGPPFDPANFPGTPAILVRADTLWANYSLRSEFTTDRTMAFFPGTVLAGLHALMGDVRQVMSVLAVTSQVLVAVGVLAGLSMLTRLLARRLALLRALGAPSRFIFALTWSFATLLIAGGAVLGLLLGIVTTVVISNIVSEQTDILVTARLGWRELHLVAGFVSLTGLLSLLPAALATRRPVEADLRA